MALIIEEFHFGIVVFLELGGPLQSLMFGKKTNIDLNHLKGNNT